MTPPSTLTAHPNPFQQPPLTAGHLLKPLDFTSTKTLFLFPLMPPAKVSISTTADDGDEPDSTFYLDPSP